MNLETKLALTGFCVALALGGFFFIKSNQVVLPDKTAASERFAICLKNPDLSICKEKQ